MTLFIYNAVVNKIHAQSVTVFFIILVIVFGGIWFITKNGGKSPGDAAVIVESIFDTSIPAPSLEREPAFSANFPKELEGAVNENMGKLKKMISEDGSDTDAWLDLALQYKTAGDSGAAREIWEYLYEAMPNEGVSAYNLGNMHHLELQNYEKAEEYYREAIVRNSNLTINYLGLHELYKYSYKTDSGLAIDVLEEGVFAVPNAVDLVVVLAGYYKEKGDMVNARKWYTDAMDMARELENTKLEQQLEAELNALQ